MNDKFFHHWYYLEKGKKIIKVSYFHVTHVTLNI